MERYFVQYALHEQEILNRKESVDKVLALVPEDILSMVSCLSEEPMQWLMCGGKKKHKKQHFSLDLNSGHTCQETITAGLPTREGT